MTITPRSLAVGLGAWCLAFLVAYSSNINPVHLTAVDIAILGVSLVIGILAVRFGRKRFCRSASESGAAIMTFATSWFAGIYFPITAIWANAPFYTWVSVQKVKPHGDVLVPWLIPAIEKTAATHFLGVAVLFSVGYLVMRRTRLSISSAKTRQVFDWKLDWVDSAFGLVALALGLAVASIGPGLKFTEPVQVLGCVGGAFLLCFIFRSLRLQGAALKMHVPETSGPSPSRKIGILCVVTLWLPFVVLAPLVGFLKLSGVSSLLLCILIFLTPWFIYRIGCGRTTDIGVSQSHQMNHFAVRCSIWFWLGFSLVLFGLVLPGIAESEMNKAGALATPFALAVVSLKPIFCIFALPAVGACVGSLVMMWFLPRRVSVSERVLVCAQAGAVGMMIAWILTGPLAAGLTMTVSAFSPDLPIVTLLPHLREWVAEGQWVPIALLSMLNFGFLASWTAAVWAAEAIFECGLEWLVDGIKRRRQIPPAA